MKEQTHEAIMEAIKTAINAKMANKSVKLRHIAQLMGVSVSKVSRWRSGQRRGSHSTINELKTYMEALGIDSSEYLGDDDSEYVSVPLMKAVASMGGGSCETRRSAVNSLPFRLDWIERKGNLKTMAVIHASGGSMEPTIPDDSLVLIDESQVRNLVNNQIYFVCYGDQIFLKRLKVKAGRAVALMSDAEGIEDMEIGDDDYFHIIGRAIWYCKEL